MHCYLKVISKIIPYKTKVNNKANNTKTKKRENNKVKKKLKHKANYVVKIVDIKQYLIAQQCGPKRRKRFRPGGGLF